MHRLIIAIILIVALAACGAKAEPAGNAENSEQNTASVSENAQASRQDETTVETAEITPASEPANAPKPTAVQPEEPKQENKGYKVTFLEIGAESCIPCKMMQPIMKEIAEEYPGVVEVIFHDLYKEREIGQKYRIRVMPTQVFLNAEGKEFFRHEGFYPKAELKAMLDKHLATLE
jgi:thioredoxin 1